MSPRRRSPRRRGDLRRGDTGLGLQKSLVEVEGVDETDQMFDLLQRLAHLLLTGQDVVFGFHAFLMTEGKKL